MARRLRVLFKGKIYRVTIRGIKLRRWFGSAGGGAAVDTGGDRDSWPRNWGSGFESNPEPASTHGGGRRLERMEETAKKKIEKV
jgi:hypothetical protein